MPFKVAIQAIVRELCKCKVLKCNFHAFLDLQPFSLLHPSTLQYQLSWLCLLWMWDNKCSGLSLIIPQGHWFGLKLLVVLSFIAWLSVLLMRSCDIAMQLFRPSIISSNPSLKLALFRPGTYIMIKSIEDDTDRNILRWYATISIFRECYMTCWNVSVVCSGLLFSW